MPEPPIGGVQATELVIVHWLELEMRRPGSWNSALVRARPSAPTKLLRYLVFAQTKPAFQLRFGRRRVKASISTPLLTTPALVPPSQAPVSESLSVSASSPPIRSPLQELTFSTMKLRPLKVWRWKSRNSCRRAPMFTSMPRPLYFRPSSNASLISGLNCRSSPEAIRCWQPACPTLMQIAPLPDSAGLLKIVLP